MIDFTKLNKLSKNQTIKTKNGNDTTLSKKIDSYSPLQYKVDLNQKKDEFYRKIYEESQAIRIEVQSYVSMIMKMIEEEISISRILAEVYFKLMNLSKNPMDTRDRLRYLYEEKNNEIARIVLFELVTILLNNMKEAYIQKQSDDVGEKMRLENAMKKHEELLIQLSDKK
ncbi:TPA: hypothetical protein U1266_000034 [Streptococcus suis]|nr:hypothetical protein [Streptococcus suis]HEM5153168.1 hypothetical protein [Streptococcus suis]HEM5155388.1 hypothetical protein [Streptococcus suis]HEM5168286.1 hypothetical protein [Streptococcus suis]HEM5181569.1 hypothetical protein [Streptococcus suis]